MTQKFVLELDALSTPAGLSAACESARAFVEAEIPGEHRPGPLGYFWHVTKYSVEFPAGFDVLAGCRCAGGFLRTAMCGGLQAAYNATSEEMKSLYEAAGGATWQVYEFERGFDQGFAGSAEELCDDPWLQAGFALGRKWVEEDENR